MAIFDDTTELHIRVPQAKAERLKALAKSSDRSLAQLIRDILNKYLDETASLVTMLTLALLGP